MQLCKKEKSPFYQATRMVYNAIEMAYQYQNTSDYKPTTDDLFLLSQLKHALDECSHTATYIISSVKQRTNDCLLVEELTKVMDIDQKAMDMDIGLEK